LGYLSAGEDAGEAAGPIVAGLLWAAFGIPAVLGVRIGLAVVAELYTLRMNRRFGTGLAPARAVDRPAPARP
jgi:hypothetical protein